MVDFSDLTVIATGIFALEVIAILLVLDVVMRPRSSQAAIAWSIALLSLPVITIPLYLVFGRTRFVGYSEAIRDKETAIERSLRSWYADMADHAAKVDKSLEPINDLVRGLTNIPFTRGNQVTLLIDGEATYEAMFEAIQDAEKYILIQFYIVKDGNVGNQMQKLLTEKARAGIKVHFLYDEIGCWKLPAAYLDELRGASVEVSGFKTTQGRQNRFQVNFRNHRKLLIVDGHTAFIGGHNLADEYLGYRDTHLRLTGPAAQHIQLTFMKDWFWATRKIPDTSAEIPAEDKQGAAVAIVNTGPADTKSNCSALFATLFHSARKRLWLTSPYFVPDDTMVRGLQAAAIRGVDVRILLPGKADHYFVELASFTYYNKMMDCGVKIFRYQDKFLHQKVILVDDNLAGVGTVNLDNRSLYLNFEATALIANQDFAAEVEEMLCSDFRQSILISREHYDAKPLLFRAAARGARLASPLL